MNFPDRNEFNFKDFIVEFVNNYRFLTLIEEKLSVNYEDHSRISETTF